MKRAIKRLIQQATYILLMGIIVSSCNEPSEVPMVNGSQFSAAIQVMDYVETGLREVSVSLSDIEGEPICNQNIIISVNGKKLRLMNGKGNYYDTSCTYVSSDIPLDKLYYFNIQLEDSVDFELAAYIPFKELSPINTSISKDKKGYTIAWQSIPNFTQLQIEKTYFNSETGTHADSLISKKINPLKGEFYIDAAFFKNDSINTVKDFDISFIGAKGGLLNPKLLDNSFISAHSIISVETDKIIE